ncbi:MAG: hypothetical protein ABSD59_04655 [Terracidiphilus sp.]|jgi:hypothetical protein
MSDTYKHEPNAPSVAVSDPPGPGNEIPVSKFEVVPYGDSTNEKELYSFRELMPKPVEPDPAKIKSQPVPVNKILIPAASLAFLAFIAVAVARLFQPAPLVSYVDLGGQRFDPASLSGRLIAKWETSGSYQLFLDPIGQQQAANFAALAVDPPRQLSVTIRLLDDGGRVVCQKQIFFPPPVPRAADGNSAPPPEPPLGPPLQPQQTGAGDTIQNMNGESGQIAEIDLRGPLPCPQKDFAKFKTWDFVADFPTPAEEVEWQRQEKLTAAKSHAAKGKPSVHIARLSASIEGDDVIVGDNPSHGTVQTSAGRVFFLGEGGMRNRTAAWQVFPAAIHFRCDKNGSCALTRANSPVVMQARLVK